VKDRAGEAEAYETDSEWFGLHSKASIPKRSIPART
jgi:hypothetical protein